MNKVFFGGSRKIGRLSQIVKERTDNIIANGYLILIGDANGADRAVQSYLAKKNYRNVLVFCMGDMCRNNVGEWNTRNIHSDIGKKNFDYYSIKDAMMSAEADYGFMLWDGKSKGTLNNILNLCEQNKKVLVYFSPTNRFYTIKDMKDVSKLLEQCDKESIRKFDQSLGVSGRVHSQQQQLNLS